MGVRAHGFGFPQKSNSRRGGKFLDLLERADRVKSMDQLKLLEWTHGVRPCGHTSYCRDVGEQGSML
jgi:hypothetical protein